MTFTFLGRGAVGQGGVDKTDVYILNPKHICRCTLLKSSSVYSVFALMMVFLIRRVNDSVPMGEEKSLFLQ